MQKITFINAKGQSITFWDTKPFILSHIDGMTGTNVNFTTSQAPGQDGITIHDVLLEARIINLRIAIMAKDRKELYKLRQQMTQILNPKFGDGKLIYKNDAGTKEIPATCDSSPIPGDRYSDNQLYDITFYCQQPFWLDNYVTSREMAYLLGGFKFSLSLPSTFGYRSYKRKIQNEGDVETPVRIEFKGPAINPTVTNVTTGEYITVLRDLGDNDTLYISTEFGHKRVEIQRSDGELENAFHYIDINSTFFKLIPGENVIEYKSNNDSIKTRVIIKYQNMYYGV